MSDYRRTWNADDYEKQEKGETISAREQEEWESDALALAAAAWQQSVGAATHSFVAKQVKGDQEETIDVDESMSAVAGDGKKEARVQAAPIRASELDAMADAVSTIRDGMHCCTVCNVLSGTLNRHYQHLQSRDHLRAVGQSRLAVDRATADDVQRMLARDTSTSRHQDKQSEQEVTHDRKRQRRRRRRKKDDSDDGDDDDDVSKMLGFKGFGKR
jgi:hypothetical protein